MAPTCTAPRLLADETLHEAIRTFVSARAADVDACRCTLRQGIAHLATHGAVEVGVLGRDAPEAFERMCEIVATVALDDLSQAFSLWAHRMAIEYVHQADAGAAGRMGLLTRLADVSVLGSTSFASATANALAGTPLPLKFRRGPDGVAVVSGRIPWASNLETPFVSVAAAANLEDPSDRMVFTYDADTPGLALPEPPRLLALQATASTSPVFRDARIEPAAILTHDFLAFVRRVFPTFLLLQCAFCWGLGRRALAEADDAMRGPAEVLRDDLLSLQAEADSFEARVRAMARHADRPRIPSRDLLEVRLRAGRLAVDAVALEAKVAGGRGYLLDSGTARRLREAAFLPVQAPTEVQLRWLLSHSA